MRNTIFITCAVLSANLLSGESLWHSKKNNETSMFADRTAMNVGDILSVRINETTVVSRNSSKTTSSSTNISHDIDSFLYPDSSIFRHDGVLPSIGISPNDSFSGEGSYSDSNVVEARIAVMVVDVQPNGNLIVEGARKVESNGERQYIVMRGIVRKDDIRADNSVISTNILNANVEILGDGDLATAQRKGWINQLLDAANIL